MIKKTYLAILLICVPFARADEPVVAKGGIVLLKFGVVELEDSGGKKTEYDSQGQSNETAGIVLRRGETLRVRGGAECDVVFPEAGTVKLGADSVIRLPPADGMDGKSPSLEMLGGKLFLDIDAAKLAKGRKQFRLKTPTAILAVKGTRFFVVTEDGTDTAGVIHGRVEMTEPVSGASLVIDAGRAAIAKRGVLSPLRNLTGEELADREIFRKFVIEFEPLEKGNRNFEPLYDAQTDPNAAIPSKHPDLVKVEKSPEADFGTALKMTVLPLPGEPTASISAGMKVAARMSPRSEPVGITFMARGTDVRRFRVSGNVHYKKRCFAIKSAVTLKFPDGARADEWLPFFIPLEEGDPREILDAFTFWVDPNLHEGRAVESIVEVEKDKAQYTLEISPVMIGTRPDK